MLCPVYGHELTPLSCPPSQGVSFRSFKGLIILSPYRRVNGEETLDHDFQLGRDGEIVHGRHENNGVSRKNQFADLFEIVFLHAGAIHAAFPAAEALVHVESGAVKAGDFMPCPISAPDKGIGQGVGVAVFSGTAAQNENFHRGFS